MMNYFLALLVFVSGYYCNNERPHVTTSVGAISGYLKPSYNGRKFAAFEGIPYAKPPIGDRRFEEPAPIKSWHGTWNATFLTTCPQISYLNINKTSGVEDCLYINVYVPREKPNPNEKLEVVVHIHGGAYMCGSGHEFNPPERPMDRDIIFVTFNYRLGILGFLSTQDSVVSENNGLKDQALALRWIKDNIACFGGNPDSVTLTGTAAGGSSVHMHYFSEQSKGLFHRGFSQSDLALNPWSIVEQPLSKAKKLAVALGCPVDSTRVLVDCLKERPQNHFLDETKKFFGYKTMLITLFGPVVETGGTNPFLKEHPYVLLRNGKLLDVPWILSLDSHKLLFVDDADQAVLLQSKSNKSPVYFFVFAYPGEKNIFKIAADGAEARYMFGDLPLFQLEPLTSNELQMNDAVWDLVVSYVEKGKPTIAGVELVPTNSDILTYRVIF